MGTTQCCSPAVSEDADLSSDAEADEAPHVPFSAEPAGARPLKVASIEKAVEAAPDAAASEESASDVASEASWPPKPRRSTFLRKCCGPSASGPADSGPAACGLERGDILEDTESENEDETEIDISHGSVGDVAVKEDQASRGLPQSLAPQVAENAPSFLGPVVLYFRAAVVPGTPECAADLRREPLLAGLESYAVVLDRLGGGLGNYILANTKKLRASKAPSPAESYRAWLLSELPVQAATGYASFVDDSAWMGNLWISWLLEFFVELFARLDAGGDTRESAEAAYKVTLRAHHNFIQSAAFSQAVKKLPARRDLYASLRGEAPAIADVERDMGDFVAVARPLVRCCLQINDELDARLKQERRAFKN